MSILINKNSIKDVLFSKDDITIVLEDNKRVSQKLRYYPLLEEADDKEKQDYTVSLVGLHWEKLNTDISFESFFYDFSQPFVFHNNK